MEKDATTVEHPTTSTEKQTYNVGNYAFIVTPIYSKNTTKTVHDIMLELMQKDAENVIV